MKVIKRNQPTAKEPTDPMTSKRQAVVTPRCIVIAGPNGAGKTTFAREFLPKDTDVVHFVNADLIASGLSAIRPEIAAMTAGRVFLAELERLARARTSFAFETTLSGLTYASRLVKWKASGFRVEIADLKISSPELALKRIAARVRQGGHDVPRVDVVRRFGRSWVNFVRVYQPMADVWSVYDNSGATPRLLEQKS
ncbi:MAG: zeta toxin family protein [Casimicrobiaceae bacterium]